MDDLKPKKPQRAYWLIWLVTLSVLAGTVFGIVYWVDTQQNIIGVKEPQDFNAEQDSQFVWDLSAMYKDAQAAQQALEQLKAEGKTFLSFKGKLHRPEIFKQAMKLYESLLINEEKLRIYANLKRDIAMTDGITTDFLAEVEQLDTVLTEQMAYFKPELTKLSDRTLQDYLNMDETKDYQPIIEEILYDRQSVLSEREDKLIGLLSDLDQTFENNYQAFWNRYDVPLDNAAYDDYYSKDDEKRFEATRASLQKQMDAVEVLASNLEGKVKYDNLMAKAYAYDSALEMVLSQDGLTMDAYKAYEKTTNDHLKLYHRWIALKQRMLGLDRTYRFHDQQLTLLDQEQEYPYELAQKSVRASLEPLGDEYLQVYDKALKERWVDVYPREGKYTGAYTWGAYASHPYVLLNYNNQFVNASTFAHEMGHAANGYLSSQNQPFSLYETSIFKAEIASTTNEVLFLEHQLKTETGKVRQEILIQYIDLIISTAFEQMKASEFEKLIHEAQASGKDLDGDFLTATWRNLNAKYYGAAYEVSELDGYGWTDIDHLYWNFYMYKYATGLASGYNIAESLLTQPEKARKAYMNFLKSGRSKDTLEELSTLNIVLEDGKALEKCYEKLSQLMDALDASLEK